MKELILKSQMSYYDTCAEFASEFNLGSDDLILTNEYIYTCLLYTSFDSRGRSGIGHMGRFTFYEEAKKAYAIIATSEKALYANIMLQKGVVTD